MRPYTTGDAARLCGLSQKIIIKAFDQGILKGFKVPGSTHRRILHESLIEFIKENGIPINGFIEKPSTFPDYQI